MNRDLRFPYSLDKPSTSSSSTEGATEESWAGGTEAWLRLATGVDASSPEN